MTLWDTGYKKVELPGSYRNCCISPIAYEPIADWFISSVRSGKFWYIALRLTTTTSFYAESNSHIRIYWKGNYAGLLISYIFLLHNYKNTIFCKIFSRRKIIIWRQFNFITSEFVSNYGGVIKWIILCVLLSVYSIGIKIWGLLQK
jgi:hypothetical protein